MASTEIKAVDLSTKDSPEPSWGIVGYRFFTDRERFDTEMEKIAKVHGHPTLVVSGGATGADTLAKEWARDQSIPFAEHVPSSHTARDLLARNSLIVRDSTMIIAFLSTQSRGTLDTIRKAQKAKKMVVIIKID